MPPCYPILSDQGLPPVHLADAFDQYGHKHQVNVAGEHPLTIKIDGKELVTLMTIGSQPELLVLGYLRNQVIFDRLDQIESITVNWDREVADVTLCHPLRPDHAADTHHDSEGVHPDGAELKGQILIDFTIKKLLHDPLPELPLLQSDIYKIIASVKAFNATYRDAGSVHGCGLCKSGEVLLFFEDVGRHGATDALAGKMWMDNIEGGDKVFYTTGRLTSEIVVKSALMGIPALISRNGATYMAFELAKQLGITLICRAKSHHFLVLNGHSLVFDVDLPKKSNALHKNP